MRLSTRHIISINDLTKKDVLTILQTADSFKEISLRPIKKVPTLRGKTVINCFFEDSTRTRMSFEIAEKRLSADTVNIGKRPAAFRTVNYRALLVGQCIVNAGDLMPGNLHK